MFLSQKQKKQLQEYNKEEKNKKNDNVNDNNKITNYLSLKQQQQLNTHIK